jgi:hypothetical protein
MSFAPKLSSFYKRGKLAVAHLISFSTDSSHFRGLKPRVFSHQFIEPGPRAGGFSVFGFQASWAGAVPAEHTDSKPEASISLSEFPLVGL